MAFKNQYDKKRTASSTPLKEAIEDMLKAYHLDKKLSETMLISSWKEIMGNTIASRTNKLYIRNKILYAEINSSALKQDLSLSKQKLIQLLNKSVGTTVITDVVIR